MEKTIITGKRIKMTLVPIIGTILAIICFLEPIIEYQDYAQRYHRSIWQVLDENTSMDELMWSIALGLIILTWGFYLIITISKFEITVTDKRVFGRAWFGKRVDLPLDSISAVGTSILHGISVSSASGAIRFSLIKNNGEIHKAISELLLERQNKPKAEATTIKQEMQQSDADEIKKFKELLDADIITKEEFDAKKKQLLGL